MSKAFFEKVAIEARTADLSLVRDVYYGLMRHTIKELVKGNEVTFPDFGKFYTIAHKERRIKDMQSREIKIVPAIHMAKFKASVHLKKYIKLKYGDRTVD